MGTTDRIPVDVDLFPVCDRCDEKHVRHERRAGAEVWFETCRGHRTNGLPCKKYPVTHTRVCERHGGSAPQVKATASRKAIEDDIRKTLASELVRANPETLRTDPIQGLMWEVAMSAQAVEWLALQMGDLNVPRPNEGDGPMRGIIGVNDDGTPRFAQPASQLWGPDRQGSLTTHVLYQMWCEERDRHARMCALAIKAGVSERMVAIAESQGIQIVSVIAFALDSMDVPAAEKVKARAAAAARLRELGPGAAAAIDTTATG